YPPSNRRPGRRRIPPVLWSCCGPKRRLLTPYVSWPGGAAAVGAPDGSSERSSWGRSLTLGDGSNRGVDVGARGHAFGGRWTTRGRAAGRGRRAQDERTTRGRG